MVSTNQVASHFSKSAKAVVYRGDCMELLRSFPNQSVQLVVTSPPYNIGKSYEKTAPLERYLALQKEVIRECFRILKPEGSVCWQVGNFVEKRAASSIIPLDIVLHPIFAELGFKLRNRVVWHFEHGLHCSNRLSGRYETILWFTKTDDYHFDVDPIRIPQKYPGKKYFKGPKAGQYSCNPLGKNPGDVWIIPNVKSNHVEKTTHPCQFPVELVERLVLSLSKKGDWVFDPFAGVGTTMAAAIKHDRKGAGAEILEEYCSLATERVHDALNGQLKARPMNTPVFDPAKAGSALRNAPWQLTDGTIDRAAQLKMLEGKARYRIKAS